MPVKKTDKKTITEVKKTKSVKSLPLKKLTKKFPKINGPKIILVKRVATKMVIKKITNATKVKKVLPAKIERRRQTLEEMEYKLSMLRPASDRSKLVDEVELKFPGKKNTSFKKFSIDEFKLPTNMSVRSIKKAEVIRSLFSDDTTRAAQKVAYVSSACLIAFGLFFSLATDNLPLQSQAAQLNSSMTSTVDPATFTTTTTNLVQPLFELTTAIPGEVLDDVQINFVAQHVSAVQVKIKSFGNGSITNIPATNIKDSLYKFTIPGKTLAPGEHRVSITLRSLHNTSIVEKNFSFIKPKPAIETTQSNNPLVSAVPEPIEQQLPEIKTNEVGNVVEPATVPLTDTEKILENAAYTESLNILLPQTNVKGITIVGFNAPEDTTGIIVFIRNKSSLTSSRLGAATRSKLATNWQYLYDSRQRPDGDYELFAEAKLDSGKVLRDSVNINVSNVIKAELLNISPTGTIEKESVKIENATAAPERIALPVPRLPREFVPVIRELETTKNEEGAVSNTETQTSTSDKLSTIEELTKDILITNREVVEDLYQRYSVALQSGDEMLIKAIESDIAAANSRFTTELLKDADTNYYADDVDRELKERFETMKKRIVAFEEIRKTASNQKSSIDSDGDGVSDFDEENLYFTDENNPDTDNDGIIDGVEVIRGFDPLNPSAEAILAYESPKESFGLIRQDVLKVNTVVPVLVSDDEGETLPVQAEIKGVALPNSFATLFIFSTPVIVTVKTDETGAFSYTFDKELEDGEHEVYVAVTDNTGAIIAQSNPFRFIKEAQAFTPRNGDDSLLAQSSTIEPISDNPYNITVGFGILALGLILLMLGVGLRPKEENIVDNATA